MSARTFTVTVSAAERMAVIAGLEARLTTLTGRRADVAAWSHATPAMLDDVDNSIVETGKALHRFRNATGDPDALSLMLATD